MKKLYLIIMIILILFSCAGIENKSSTVFYEDIPSDSAIYLRSVNIIPEMLLQDVSEELPEFIKSCLIKSGFTYAENDLENVYKLDIFLNSRSYQHHYNPIESITLSMRFYKNGVLTAYRIDTEDTEKSIDSFPWTLDFIESNIHKFSLLTGSNE